MLSDDEAFYPMILIDPILIDVEAVSRIGKTGGGLQASDGAVGFFARRIDTDELDIFFAVVASMNMLQDKDVCHSCLPFVIRTHGRPTS